MWRKRILSGLLACLMVLSSIPATALAEEPLLLEETSSFTAETIEETLPEETETTEETLPEETEDTEPTEQTLPEVTEDTEPTEETLPEVTEDTEATEETLPEAEEELLLVEAEPVDAAPEAEGDVVFVEIPFQVNPLYEGLVDPADYEDWEPEFVAPSTYGLRTEYLTEAEAAVSIREYMCARENVFTVSFTTTKEYTDTDYALLVGQAMTHTGKPTEGDYLRWQYGGYSISGSYRPLSDGTYQYSITITIPYYSSAAQEAEVDAAVDALLTQLDLDGLSDYGKIKAVYDYICKTVTYDFGNLNNKEYTLKYTAYAALLNEHTAVCQGYAVLLYRLALELGIDCRFISGIGNGGPHGWNIIKLGDKYYNADSTWDAGKTAYRYFLKGSGFDRSHIHDEEYTTGEFNAAYPMADADYAIIDSGPCGENLNWVLDGSGTLTISGSGEMQNYFPEGAPWYSRRNSITRVVIQPGVTSLGEECFYGCQKLTSVSIPDTVTTLKWGCFMECSRLASIVLPDSITSMEGCFGYCTSLTSISIPYGVTSLPASCFNGCTRLTSVSIPNSVTTIENDCFSDCTSLTSITIPDSVTYLKFRCFDGCTSLTSITIPASVRTLGYCFGGCTNLSEVIFTGSSTTLPTKFFRDWPGPLSHVVLPEGLTALEEHYFWNCTSLTSIDIPDSVTSLGAYCFSNCAGLTSITIPNSVTSLGKGCFVGCTSLTSITIADSITALPERCFERCTGLTSINIPGTLTNIGPFCFTGCTSLTSVTIPDSVTTFGPGWNPESITEVVFTGSRTALPSRLFDYRDWPALSRVVLPEGLTELEDECFFFFSNLTSIELPNSVTSLGKGCFQGCTSLTSITIPDNVTSIGENCFLGCAGLTSITIPDNVTSIGENCFLGCAGLTSVTLPKSITSIPSQCFDRCPSLKSIVIPEGVTSLGPSCFNDCTALTDVSLPDTLTDLGGGCFVGCTSLTDITLPNTLTTLGNSCFSGCTGLTDITLPNALTTLGGSCFSHCTGLTDITLPNTLTTLGDDCFHFCTGLTSIDIPDGVTSLGWYCFSGCTGLTAVNIPGSVTSLGPGCFDGCTSLTSVSIPESVTFIGDSCFKDCASLTAVNIPDSVTSIGEYCFSGCGNLQMFDLSGIPGNMEFRDTLSLDGLVTVPPAFQSCEWTLQTLSGEPDTDNIARITKGDDGAHQLEIIGSGRFQLVLLDETSKAQGSTTIEATGSTEILAARNYLFSGGKLQLSVVDLADNSKPKVQWSVVEGAGFASISSGGVLTAKTVSEEQVVTVSSTVVSRGDRAYMRFRILPKSEGIFLKMGEETLNESRDLDMSQISSVSLSAFTPRVEEALAVTWASSNTKVAAVDKTTGVVTLKYPGTAKITATAADGSGVKSGVTLNVSYLDAAKTLKAVLEELPPIGLQPGQSAKMVVSGTSSIDADNLIFKSSNPAIAAVAEDGTITATGEKTGSVTITASLKGDDPLDRKVSAKITVISMQADTLTLTVPEGMETEDGTLVFDKSDADQSFTLSAETTDWHHAPFAADITWSSSDTSVAKVDGAGKVTIPANANGECVVTATSNDFTKASDQISVSVRDYSPRLAETVLSMNTALKQGATVGLVESYGRGIDSVRVLEETSLFEAVYEDNLLTIKPKETAGTIKKGTYSLTLAVEDEDGKIYDDYRITLKASESLPSVSVKQAEKINLFYTDSTANLSISAPGKTIEGVELTLTDDFYVTYSEGAATLHYAKSPKTTKLDTKATLEIWLDGYRVPVTKTITISTTTSAPKLRLSSTASTINTALGDKSVRIQVLDGSGEALDNADISASASFATPSVDGNTLTLTLNGTSGGTASIYVTRDNWSQSVKLTHKVSVSTKLPTVKLASTALKLDRYFTYKTAQTTVSLSQSNLALENVTVEPAARESSSTAKKIGWTYDKDAQCLTASFNNTDDIKAGTYSFTYRGTLSDGTSVTGGTLKITVGGSLPKVKLSATTVKLNSSLDEKESVLIRPTISGGTGYTLVGMKVTESTDWLRFTDDALQVKLTGTPSSKKYTFHVSPVFQIDGTGTQVTLTAQTLTVQVYSSTPKVSSLSAKGKLDTLNPASAITYTPKLANCLGTVTAVHLDEAYSTQFDATVVNGSVQLTLKEGVQYATNVTYKVRFRLTVCGKELLSPVVRVKVTQSSVKLTASPTSLTLFQSQTAPLTGKLTMSAGQVGAISVNSRSSSELKAAIKRLAYNNTTQKLTLFFGNKGLLKAGKSYTLYLDVTPVNNAQNLKPTQIKLTVKVSK